MPAPSVHCRQAPPSRKADRMEARSVALLRLLATVGPDGLCSGAGTALAQDAAGIRTPGPAPGRHRDQRQHPHRHTLIRREMDLIIGQPFSFDDMDAAWDDLEDTGYFAFVDMEYDGRRQRRRGAAGAGGRGPDHRVRTAGALRPPPQVPAGRPPEREQLPRPRRDYRGCALGLLHPARGAGLEAALAVRGRGPRGALPRRRGERRLRLPPHRLHQVGPGPGAALAKFAGPVYLLGAADYGQFRQRDDYSCTGGCPTAARARPPAAPSTAPAPATTGC